MAQLIFTFSVEDTDEIIPKIRRDYGDKALIITNKQIRSKSLNRSALYEVMITIEESDYNEHLKKMPQIQKTETKKINSEFIQPKAQEIPNSNEQSQNFNARENILKASENFIKNYNEKSLKNEFDAQKMENFERQINELNNKMNLLVDMMWKNETKAQNIFIPPEFASIYKKLKECGAQEKHLEAIMKAGIENMPSSMRTSPDAINRYFHQFLRNILPCRREGELKNKKIIMLVGPTGVGKTTTLAKLAFRYAYGEQHYKTGIITLDTYRIGAVEQLFQYAKIMKLPIIEGISGEDLNNAINSLNRCEVILIDTTGNSQYDQKKLAKTKEFLSATNAQIDVNLVLCASTKYEDLMEIYKNFSHLNIDTLIFTKLDETKFFGNIFSLIFETNTPISFFSTGQEVPDDLKFASGDFLATCILDGFKGQ